VSRMVTTVKAARAGLFGLAAAWLVAVTVAVAGAQAPKTDAAKIKNPVKPTAESIAAGKTAYNKYCKFCHNEDGTGNGALAPKDTHPPSLVDAKWDHGSTDGEIYTLILNGAPPRPGPKESEMKPMKGTLMPTEIWQVVNYIRTLGPNAARAAPAKK
jgi:mono/diheme cytochrome c family protein